jgi:sulfur carrier protein ThiS
VGLTPAEVSAEPRPIAHRGTAVTAAHGLAREGEPPGRSIFGIGPREIKVASARRVWYLRGVRVSLNPQGRRIEVDGVSRVDQLLRRLDILPGTVLVIRGANLLTEDARLEASDEIELRSVVSGG